MKKSCMILFLTFISNIFFAQANEYEKRILELKKENEKLKHRIDILEKKTDDVYLKLQLGDKIFFDKLILTGPPKWKVKNPTEQGANNPVKFWSYIFFKKDIDINKRYPLIIFVHGGVHGNFSSYYFHILKELLYQGYIVAAPEYRGSTGYGEEFYKSIDYGGREIEDAVETAKYMIENYSFVDEDRIGIIGWSHGGLIALMASFNYPDLFKCCFAGVPVSDLIARMGYRGDSYERYFDAEYHIGKTAEEDIEEYKRRSPVYNVEKAKIPILIHTNTNDEDVNYIEVYHLINALKAANKKFEYQVYENYPGGHAFDRIDIKKAKEIRTNIYKFLSKYLKPEKVLDNVKKINEEIYYK